MPVNVVLEQRTGRIVGDVGKNILNEIDEALSYEMEGYKYSEHGLGWSGTVRKFNRFSQVFPVGIYRKVTRILKVNEIKFNIVDSRPVISKTEEEIMRAIDEFPKALRPYHVSGVLKGIKNRNMTYWWCTSSGKTVLFAFLIKLLNLKTLVLIHRNDILEQHIKSLERDLGEDVGKISQGEWDVKRVTVATVQSLVANLKRDPKKVKKYLEDIRYLVFDEAHHAEAKTWKKIAKLCSKTHARHGFSGTPYSLTASDLELECVAGEIDHKVTLSDLIKSGYVCKPIIKMRHLHTPVVNLTLYSAVYDEGIVNNEQLNRRAVIDIMEEFEKERQILVTVRMVKHGHIISDYLKEEGLTNKEFEYIHGGTPQEIRNQIKKKFQKKSIRILIVSAIWNEGVDVPAANTLVKLDGGGGSDIRDDKGIRTTVQQVGRVIRKEKAKGEIDVDTEKIQYAYVYDYYLYNHKWLRKHSKNRFRTYQLESEFIIKEIM